MAAMTKEFLDGVVDFRRGIHSRPETG